MSAEETARRVRVVVRGRVQGVAFRAFTADAARRAGAAGWVRNRDDGAVEAVLEGPPAVVDGLLEALREGPRLARVASVEVREEPPRGAAGFQIRA